ncbi:MAG: hypothetical protein ACUVX1_17510 [Chloroflexota bacterium]
MIIEADIKCYYCGHISGHVVGDADQPLHPKTFQPISCSSGYLPKPKERPRCQRCGGPVFLDDITVRREKKRVAIPSRQLRMVAAR